jgi:hypothetical protein
MHIWIIKEKWKKNLLKYPKKKKKDTWLLKRKKGNGNEWSLWNLGSNVQKLASLGSDEETVGKRTQ